jgi:hypothetical protein
MRSSYAGDEHVEYFETDEEVAETSECVIRYIVDGEELDQVFDLRGLAVFGVIQALRENDKIFHGDTAELSDEQRSRLREVESVVDTAVETNMHYYPFGDSHNKRLIGGGMYAELSATKQLSGKVRSSKKREKSVRRSALNQYREERRHENN